MAKKLTEADERHLKYIKEKYPKGWFTAMDVYPNISRTDYSLGRLEERDVLESR